MGKSCDIVKGLYNAFAEGNLPAVLGAFDPQIEWREADSFLYADGNPYVGPQAVAEGVFLRLVSAVENFVALPQRFVEGDDIVVVEGRYRGKMRVTGRHVDAQFAHVWQLRDGRIVRFQQYTDTWQWAKAAGS